MPLTRLEFHRWLLGGHRLIVQGEGFDSICAFSTMPLSVCRGFPQNGSSNASTNTITLPISRTEGVDSKAGPSALGGESVVE